MKVGRVMVRLEKRNMEDGVQTREVRWEAELINEVGELALDGERSETDVVEFIGGTGSLDVTAEEPDELVRLVGWGFGNVAVIVF